jgi:hypothetical protein
MNRLSPRPVFALVAVAAILLAAAGVSRSQDAKKAAADLDAMMQKAKKFTEPGKAHRELERFLGKWQTETRLFMGGQGTPAEKGSAEGSWLMEGRWLKLEWTGSMMGRPVQGFSILGYDNFKMSYVSSSVTSLDTTLAHTEGDMDPSGNVFISYGTIDEYLTGEHDKMVKYVWRFTSKDAMVFEVHDLPIGEKNTKVIEVAYTRSR